MQLPYIEVEFDKKGRAAHPDQAKDAASLIAREDATDVIVLSHGWNNTFAQARDLYARIVDSIVAVRGDVAGADGRRFVVVGALWPSILWAPADDGDGRGAGVDDDADLLIAEIRERVEDRRTATALVALVPRLQDDSAAQEEFVALLRTTLPRSTKGEDEGAFEALTTATPAEVLSAARGAGDDAPAPAAAGGAADIDPAGLPAPADGGGAGFFDSLIGAARNVLNVTTYYTMKERAGVVGAAGIATLLDDLHAASGTARLHLVGHSFGGRAVTAAALATNAPVSSLSLLQAAYSHFGMARDWDGAGADGMFAAVPAKLRGPIIVTFTKNDKAVGLAYPVASRLARQIGVGLGDENDPYGGIGRNGALKTPASLPPAELLDVGGAYALQPARVSSLRADAFVSGHSDITGRQVAYAVLTAVSFG
jgi:esterase/lipase superfamily enzyme